MSTYRLLAQEISSWSCWSSTKRTSPASQKVTCSRNHIHSLKKLLSVKTTIAYSENKNLYVLDHYVRLLVLLLGAKLHGFFRQSPAGLLKTIIFVTQQYFLRPRNLHCSWNIQNFSSQLDCCLQNFTGPGQIVFVLGYMASMKFYRCSLLSM